MFDAEFRELLLPGVAKHMFDAFLCAFMLTAYTHLNPYHNEPMHLHAIGFIIHHEFGKYA